MTYPYPGVGWDKGALLLFWGLGNAVTMEVPIVLGPAMQALNEKQRKFVLAMVVDPTGTQASWAREAGYSDHLERCKVTAHELLSNPKIERAVKEVARSTMQTVGPALAVHGFMRIARDPRHRDHFKALEALADRVGMHRQTEHVVAVQHTDLRGDALIERIKRAAAVLGLDAAKLLGVNVVDEPKLIEHEPAQE